MAKRIIIVLMLGTILPAAAWSQGVRTNAGNIRDPRIALVTPAAMALKHVRQVSAGYELYYQGIANDDLQNGFASFFTPVGAIGSFGLNAQYFTSDIYRQGSFSLAYSVPLSGRMSIGLDVGLLNLSYNRSNFQLVDPNDPVFLNDNSKSTLDLGASSLINPVGSVYIGLAAKHLNNPNLSLIDDDVTAPVSLQAGIMVCYPPLSPLLNVESYDDELYVDFGLESWLLRETTMLRATYGNEDVGIGAAYVVDCPEHRLRFDYEYRYPLSDLDKMSDGFHQFILTYSSQPGDYELIVQPAEQQVVAGRSATFTVTVRPKGRWTKPVTLHPGSAYDHIVTLFAPSTLQEEGSSHLTLTTDIRCRTGRYNFLIVGHSGDQQRTCSVMLDVIQRALSGDIVASVDTLVIDEITRIRNQSPLLPYIFFEENEHTLDPDRYQLFNCRCDPLEACVRCLKKHQDISVQYKNTVNIIARRLRDNPELDITVTGCNSGWGEELENIQLSKRRAEAVRDHLVKNCGVNPDQVSVVARNLPSEPASLRDPRSREENQRVEITCSQRSQRILESIITQTTEMRASDSLCYFHFRDIVADAGIEQWEVEIVESPDNIFRIFRGECIPQKALPWNWQDESGRCVEPGKTYGYRLILRDTSGQIYTSNWKWIHVKQISRQKGPFLEKGIERTRLILFNFDSAALQLSSKSLRTEIRRIVRRMEVLPQATLLIEGHTDMIGSPYYNHELSLQRANAMADHFHTWGIEISRLITRGFGASKPLMDNNLPEGRMMNRRVEIFIHHWYKRYWD